MPVLEYLAQPLLKIDGSDASADLLSDIVQITIEESLHLPGMFTIVVSNPGLAGRSEDTPWKHEKTFSIGGKIKLGFSASTTQAQEFSSGSESIILEGEITAIEAHFSQDSQAPMVIRGYDVAHRLHRGRFNRSFQDKTDSDIVSQIASEVGISTNTITSTSPVHKYVFQQNQTNMEFLRERAARNGFELFVQDGKLNFRQPKSAETLSLTWLKDLQMFKVRVSSAEQVSSVEVRGWDYVKKTQIVSTASSATLLTSTDSGKGSDTSSSFSGKPSSPKMIVVDRPVASSSEAEKIAKSLFEELGGEFVHADARATGNPAIRPGKLVKLTKMGKYSGSYYVTEARHIYQRGSYWTELSVRGLRGGDLLMTLAPQNRLQPGQTCLVGLVTDNNDPDGLGRVRVKFPTLTPEDDGSAHASNWARVVAIGAGPGYGLHWLPEVNDEVLVGFEHGDIHRPYVLGSVWNGKDAPPDAIADAVVDGAVRLRTLKTTGGHILQFVDTDKDSVKQGIYLKTINSQELSFNDSDQIITMKTKEGFQMVLDEKNQNIEIKTKNGLSVKLDDSGKTITLTCGGCTITLDDSGKKINVASGGDVSISAGAGKNVTISGQSVDITGQTGLNLKVGGNKVALSAASVEVKSSATLNLEGTMTTVKGSATLTAEGGAMANVKGGIVKLG